MHQPIRTWANNHDFHIYDNAPVFYELPYKFELNGEWQEKRIYKLSLSLNFS